MFHKSFVFPLYLLLAVLRQWFPLSKSELGWKSKRLRLLSIVIRVGRRPWVETCPIPLSGSISRGHMCPHQFSCHLKIVTAPTNKTCGQKTLTIMQIKLCWAFFLFTSLNVTLMKNSLKARQAAVPVMLLDWFFWTNWYTDMSTTFGWTAVKNCYRRSRSPHQVYINLCVTWV